jgi:hypothetical protein
LEGIDVGGSVIVSMVDGGNHKINQQKRQNDKKT